MISNEVPKNFVETARVKPTDIQRISRGLFNAAETLEVSREAAVAIETYSDNNYEPVIAAAIDTLINAHATLPIIYRKNVLREAFGTGLKHDAHAAIQMVVANDSRLKQLSDYEFHIIDRDINSEWITAEETAFLVNTFIGNILAQNKSRGAISSFFRAIEQSYRTLTKPERATLDTALRNHPQVYKSNKDTVFVK